MAFEVHADGTLVVESEVVHIVLDETNTPAPVPGAWVERTSAFEGSSED